MDSAARCAQASAAGAGRTVNAVAAAATMPELSNPRRMWGIRLTAAMVKVTQSHVDNPRKPRLLSYFLECFLFFLSSGGGENGGGGVGDPEGGNLTKEKKR